MNALRTILLYHLNGGIFIGGGLETGVTNLLKSLQGSNLRVIFVGIQCSKTEPTQQHLNLKNFIPGAMCSFWQYFSHVHAYCHLKLSDLNKLRIFPLIILSHCLKEKIRFIHCINSLACNYFNCLPQANNSMKVNSVEVPESDIMATNGVVHFVNQLLYPGGITFIHFHSLSINL